MAERSTLCNLASQQVDRDTIKVKHNTNKYLHQYIVKPEKQATAWNGGKSHDD